MNEWISVKDQPPNEKDWLILGSSELDTVTTGIFFKGAFRDPDKKYTLIDYVTHWMYFPKPPKDQ